MEWLPTPVFLPGESYGQRSLAGCDPWGCEEWDMTDRLTLSLSEMEGLFHLLAWESTFHSNIHPYFLGNLSRGQHYAYSRKRQ